MTPRLIKKNSMYLLITLFFNKMIKYVIYSEIMENKIYYRAYNTFKNISM